MELKFTPPTTPASNIDELNNITTTDKIKSILNQNIFMMKKLQETSYGYVDDDNFSFGSDASMNLLKQYNVQPEEYEKYSDARSEYELSDRLKKRQSNKVEEQIISDMGITGIGFSFLASALDPVGWAAGGVFGKTA